MKKNAIKKVLTLLAVMTFTTITIMACNKGIDKKDNEANNSDESKAQSNSEIKELVSVPQEDVIAEKENLPIATIKIKDLGVMEVELYPSVAPNTVNNFISLANSKSYDGLIFHRIIKDFMVQGGDPLGNGTGDPGYSIKGEFSSNGATNDLEHKVGVISMARSLSPDSAGSQFFIMTSDYTYLDGDYAAFGRVISGMDVLTEMNIVQTNSNDKPLSEVVIESITVDTKGETFNEPEKIPVTD